MRSNQWFVLGIGFMLMGIGLGFIIKFDILPVYQLSQQVSMSGTSNLEVVSFIIYYISMLLSGILVFMGLLFLINDLLETRAEKRKQELAAERWIYEGGQVPEHMRMKGMPPYAPKKHPTSKDIEEIKRLKNKIKK